MRANHDYRTIMVKRALTSRVVAFLLGANFEGKVVLSSNGSLVIEIKEYQAVVFTGEFHNSRNAPPTSTTCDN